MKTFSMELLLCLYVVSVYTNNSQADSLLGLPKLSVPNQNVQSVEKIALGKQLFNDKRISQDGTVSCANCHKKQYAFTDGQTVAIGIRQQTGSRNAPTVVNAAFYQTLFLDGRASSLEEQALGPFLNPIEHGLNNKQQIVEIVRQDPQYQQQFKKNFNLSHSALTAEHIAQAIASYERSLIAGNSAFDRYLFGRDRQALTDREARGMRLFRRKGNCANCHEISAKDALFMDNRFYNLGIGFTKVSTRIDKFVQALRAGSHIEDFSFNDAQRAELGRFNVTHVIADIGKFKTPTLRNIALTSPYMHNGSIETLEEVVEYYNKGGDKNPYLDSAIFPLHFTDQEKQDLVAFLKALTSEQFAQ